MTEIQQDGRQLKLPAEECEGTIAEIAKFVQDNPLFYSLPETVIDSIARKIFIRTYDPGQVIITEGEIGDSFYIIREGHVRTVKYVDDKELVLSELGLGEGFGEMALVSNQPRSATIKAIDNVETLVLLREDFDELYDRLPELAEQVNRMMKQRVSLLESDDSNRQNEKFKAGRHLELDYSYLDLMMKLNEAAGGIEQVEHCKETGQLAREMSKILCPMVSEELLFAGYLHEIGKVSMARELVIKERTGQTLTAEEQEKADNVYGMTVSLLEPNKNLHESLYFIKYLGESDYRNMPMEAQILKVANDFLELRSRNYRNMSDEAAMEIMIGGSGSVYHPQIITALQKNIDKYKDIRVEAQLNVVRMIVMALDHKDNYTYRHSMDVRNVGLALAKRLNLSRQERDYIRIGAELHDAGKIFIDESILNAPRRLNEDEFAIMKQHANRSAEFLTNIMGMDELASIVCAHHEKFDGSGYPNGLKGQEIPYVARIMAIADVWSALTTPRVYRVGADGKPKGFTPEKAMSIMEEMADGHFDPELFAVFRELVNEQLLSGSVQLSGEFEAL